MRNRKVKIFALVLAGCLSLSGLTGCGGGIKMTTDDTSSKSDSGLMGSAKKEAEKSDESEADSADEEDKISDDMIGRYVSQGYENPSFGFAISLPDTYTLENRNNVALNDADIVESSNSEGTYDYLKSLDESYLNELVSSSKADIDKISKWDYQPDYELYVRHKSVYDNPKYFEQEKGITIYPGTNGDTNINGFVDGIFETKTLEPGMIIDRYGSNGTGKYFSPLGTPYSERALPPYMKNEPYTKYKVLVSFEVKSGEIVPWFDEVGGGTQYLSTYSVDEFKKFGYIVEVE